MITLTTITTTTVTIPTTLVTTKTTTLVTCDALEDARIIFQISLTLKPS